MAEPSSPRLYTHQELLRALIRENNIREGRWGLVFELSHQAMAVNVIKEGDAQPALLPASLVVIQKVGLIETQDVNALTVDASEILPPEPIKSTKRPSKKRR